MVKKKPKAKKKSPRSARPLEASGSKLLLQSSTASAEQEATSKEGTFQQGYTAGYNFACKNENKKGFRRGAVFMLGVDIAVAIIAACFYWG